MTPGFIFEFMRKTEGDVSGRAAAGAAVNSPAEGNDRLGDTTETYLSETEQLVLDAIREHPRIKKAEIAELVGRHETTVSRTIGRLTKRGLVERVGSNKTGFWRVV